MLAVTFIFIFSICYYLLHILSLKELKQEPRDVNMLVDALILKVVVDYAAQLYTIHEQQHNRCYDRYVEYRTESIAYKSCECYPADVIY